MNDWEYGDNDCPKCGNQLAWQRCNECEDGLWEDDDPEWPYPEHCDKCNGTGHLEWCRECGWDAVYKRFLSPQYEKEWLARQP